MYPSSPELLLPLFGEEEPEGDGGLDVDEDEELEGGDEALMYCEIKGREAFRRDALNVLYAGRREERRDWINLGRR
jgi:hypothetical protein